MEKDRRSDAEENPPARSLSQALWHRAVKEQAPAGGISHMKRERGAGCRVTGGENRSGVMTPTGGKRMRFISVIICVCLAAVVLTMPVLAAGEEIDDEEWKLFNLINTYRTEKGVKPLVLSKELTAAASSWSQEMDRQDKMGHAPDWAARILKTGYPNTYLWENVAQSPDARATFELWKNSPKHNENMLNKSAVMVGIGRSDGYWTACFGGVQHGEVIRGPQSQLVVQFTWSPANPNSASCVAFSSTVTGGAPPYAYEWNFGDGKTSREQNPRTFWSAGNYTVTLKVKDSAGKTGTASRVISIDEALPTGWGYWYSPLQVSASFSTSPPTDPVAGFPVEFRPKLRFKVSREVTEDPCHKNIYTCNRTYLWDFGDGTPKSTLEYPKHTYAKPGNYTVNMTVKDDYPEFCGGVRCYIFSDETAVVAREIRVVEPGEGEIGGIIWSDTNRNGLRDPGERGIPNMRVMLRCHSPEPASASPTPTPATGWVRMSVTTTGADGRYRFTNVFAPGVYYVRFEEPDRMMYTRNDVGNDDTIDSDAGQVLGQTPLFTLKPGESQLTWDAGMVSRPGANLAGNRSTLASWMNLTGNSSIGGTAWEDMNDNGIQDAGESALLDANMSVALWMMPGGVVDEMALTNGTYEFAGLPPGEYRVQFGPPGVHTFTAENQGADDTVDSDVQTAGNFTGFTELITLGENERQLDWDAGVIPPLRVVEHIPLTNRTGTSSIGDFVWDDVNTNGIQDDGEPGMPDVHVELVRMVSKYEFERANTTTDADGRYLFENLTNGTYFVQFTPPEGVNVTQHDAGGDDARDSDIYPLSGTSVWTTPPITLAENESQLDWDAGMIPALRVVEHIPLTNRTGTSSIGDFVWDDVNTNGIQDDGEPGMPDVHVELVRMVSKYEFERANTTTDADGRYLFENLTNGTYFVQFTLPEGANVTELDAGDDDARDSDIYPLSGTSVWTTPPITLAENESQLDWDAGLTGWTGKAGAVGTSTISGLVWNDTNRNGIQDDGEPGLQYVILCLFDESNRGIWNLTTDENGRYSFTNLSAGNYSIFVNLRKGYNYTQANQGTDDATDSDVDPATGRMGSITLAENESQLDWDAGFTRVMAGQKTTDKIIIAKYTNGEGADEPPGPLIEVGDPVTWTYEVTNPGKAPLVNVQVEDDKLGPVTGPSTGDADGDNELDPGETWTYTVEGTAEYTAEMPDGVYVNNATVTAEDADGNTTTAKDTSHYTGAFAPVSPSECPVGFTWDPPAPLAGDVVTFTGTPTAEVNFTDWAWDFGDEATGGGQEATHMYAEPGTYTVTLRVTFEGGTSCSAREEIVVAPAADNASAGEEVETPTEVITEEPTEEATERPTEEVTPGEGEIL